MTEREWWSAPYTSRFVDWLFFDAFATDRKLRLFAVACCERVRHLVTDPECLRLAELAEAFADGLVGDDVLLATADGSWQRHETRVTSTAVSETVDYARLACLFTLTRTGERSRAYYELHGVTHDAWWCSHHAGEAIGLEFGPDISAQMYESRRAGARAQQLRLLHDIFGPLPFRDITIAPSWLTSDVLALARGIYEDKAFDRMPVLADALQDAGCNSDDILSHCGDTSVTHVRGCWVIDLLLGKPWREAGISA